MEIADASDGRPRLLCLHGYASNGDTFTSVKCKALAAHVALEGLDGFVAVAGAKHGRQRSWFAFDPPCNHVRLEVPVVRSC